MIPVRAGATPAAPLVITSLEVPMFRSTLVPLCAALVVAACSDHAPLTPAGPPTDVATNAATSARERLAARLAVALADPELRQEFVDRFAASDAPEGKLQFQALARADNQRLVAQLATGSPTGVAEMLADLDAARDLEVYLPVPAHRESWHGDANLLVATIGQDGERPVAFTSTGERRLLSASTPPGTAVIALVPQEHDFDRPRATFATCASDCGDGGSDGGGGFEPPPGLYLVGTDFDENHESWLKGAPEFEFHVYGEVAGKPEQLACTGETAGRAYQWNADETHWRGSVALFTAADVTAYTQRNPKAVVRIVAWEDDDKPCVPVSDGAFVVELAKMLDQLYKGYTGAKTDPYWLKGIRSALAAFGLAEAMRNFIHGTDDLIGMGVEASIVGWTPGSANFILKGEGGKTTGSFETAYRH
jgi:hypothetical protein